MKKCFITIFLFSFAFSIIIPNSINAEELGVVINEVFPDPEGTDAGKEWIEFKNAGISEVNLKGYRLENINLDSVSIRNISITSDLILLPNVIGVISEGSISDATSPILVLGSGKLNLYNSKAKLRLYSPENVLVTEFVYTETKSGKSIESPGLPKCIKNVINESGNTIGKENLNLFSICSDTLKGIFEYSADGINWSTDIDIYSKQLFIRFIPTDNIDVIQKAFLVDSNLQETEINFPLSTDTESNWRIHVYLTTSFTTSSYTFDIDIKFGVSKPRIIPKILISTLYPSPKTGEKEYLIVKNISDTSVKETVYITDNLENPTQKKIFIELEPADELKLTDIPSLNNSGDEIYLFYEDVLIDHVIYSQASSGDILSNAAVSSFPREFSIPKLQVQLQKISEIKKNKKGTSIRTSGVVTYLDKIFSYIQDETGGIKLSGLHELTLGNTYEISGELSESLGEKKITDIENIKEVQAIQIRSTLLDVSNLELLLGQRIYGEGEINANYSRSFKISENLTISLTGYDGFDRTKGDTIRFIGVLTKGDSDSYKILPIELTKIEAEVAGTSISYPIAIIDPEKELSTTIEKIRSNGTNSLGLALGAITIYFIYRFLRTKSDILMLKFRLWRESRKMLRSPSSERSTKSDIVKESF